MRGLCALRTVKTGRSTSRPNEANRSLHRKAVSVQFAGPSLEAVGMQMPFALVMSWASDAFFANPSPTHLVLGSALILVPSGVALATLGLRQYWRDSDKQERRITSTVVAAFGVFLIAAPTFAIATFVFILCTSLSDGPQTLEQNLLSPTSHVETVYILEPSRAECDASYTEDRVSPQGPRATNVDPNEVRRTDSQNPDSQALVEACEGLPWTITLVDGGVSEITTECGRYVGSYALEN